MPTNHPTSPHHPDSPTLALRVRLLKRAGFCSKAIYLALRSPGRHLRDEAHDAQLSALVYRGEAYLAARCQQVHPKTVAYVETSWRFVETYLDLQRAQQVRDRDLLWLSRQQRTIFDVLLRDLVKARQAHDSLQQNRLNRLSLVLEKDLRT